MDSLILNIRVKIPVHLRKIKILDRGLIDQYEDQTWLMQSINNLNKNLHLILSKIEKLHHQNNVIKLNLILSEYVIRIMNDHSENLNGLIHLLKSLVKKHTVKIAFEGDPDYCLHIFEQLLNSQIYKCQKLFGVTSIAYVSSFERLSPEIVGLIKGCGIKNISGMSTIKDAMNESGMLLLLDKKAADKFISKYGLKDTISHIFNFTNIESIVIDLQTAIQLLSSQYFTSDFLIDKMRKSNAPVGGLRSAVVRKKRLKLKNEIVVNEKNDIQRVAWDYLTHLDNLENRMEEEHFFEQYSLLCQRDLFDLMNTTNNANYSNENPYESPYLTYINLMNIMKDMEIKTPNQCG